MPTMFRVACLLVVALAATAQGKVTVPSVISDHMVLQRESRVPIWGWAEAGEGVTVTLGNEAVTTRADTTGKWRVELKTGEAGGPYTLTITGDEAGESLVIRDVLLGDVWLCAGQSNMEWVVARSDNSDAETAAADFPMIRHLKVPRNPSSAPQHDQPGKWEVCSPQTVPQFTAVGYYFARKLHRELNVPIGLLNISWGGTRIEPWTPVEGFAMVDSLKPILDRVLAQDPTSEPHAQLAGDYVRSIEQWLATSRQALKDKTALAAPPAMPPQLVPFSDRQDPTALFNGMMRPVIPYRIRGAIWYQGESNHTETDYVEKTRAMVEGWRKVWQGDIPYYYVQIAPYRYGNEAPDVLPRFWAQQTRIEQELDDAAMVVINDIGNPTDIHPTNKQDVGLRLANLALAKAYGKTGIVHTGPRFKSLNLADDTLRVTFDHADGGLKSRDGKPLDHFEIIGSDTAWTPAEATVAGDTITLRAPGVKQPQAVRFAWHKLASPNFTNAQGLPAAPFLAGDVPDTDPLVRDIAEDDDYQLVYDLDLRRLAKAVKYDADHTADVKSKFDRVAYFLELQQPGGDPQWVYVSMDAFTDDVKKVGIPTIESGARFQQAVTNLFVASNVPGVPTTESAPGNIEFWPNNYGARNVPPVAGASNDTYDFGDQISAARVDGYGSMQVHLTAQKTTLFALNNWKLANQADLGIGNAPTGNPDWTFSKSGSTYEVKRLRIFVRPAR